MTNTEKKNILFTSERVQREELNINYLEEICAALTDNVTKYLRVPTPKNIEQEEKWIIESRKDHLAGEKFNFVVTDKSNNFLWRTGFTDLKSSTPEIGLWLKESVRGRGYGKEIVNRLILWLEARQKFDYIVYNAHRENIGTRKVAEKIGAVLQVDETGKEKIHTEEKFDKSATYEAVEYRIYPVKK